MKIAKTFILSFILLSITTCIASDNVAHTQALLDCAICNTAQPVLYEDALAIIIHGSPSTFKTSLLIAPKKHIAPLAKLDLGTRQDKLLLMHLISLAQMVASRLTGTQSYRIIINNDGTLQGTSHLCVVFESHEELEKA